MSCSKCDREVYVNHNECIFHCEKDGWEKSQIDFFYKEIKEANIRNKYMDKI